MNDEREFHFLISGHADVPKAKALKTGIVKLTKLRAEAVVTRMLSWKLVNCPNEDLHSKGFGGCRPLPTSIQPVAGQALPNGDRPNMRVEVKTVERSRAQYIVAEPLVYHPPSARRVVSPLRK